MFFPLPYVGIVKEALFGQKPSAPDGGLEQPSGFSILLHASPDKKRVRKNKSGEISENE
jgi:hypothetical protein